MDENRISGTARNVAGKVEEGLGRAAGDASSEFKGKLDEAAGAAQDLYGQTADAARQTAVTFDKWLRNTIETQPYTSAIVAVGIGWFWEGCIDRSNPNLLSKLIRPCRGGTDRPRLLLPIAPCPFSKSSQLHSSGL